MKIKGNKILFFSVELMAGILTFWATLLWGDWGLIAMALFFVGMIATHNLPDEREMVLLYKATALESAAMGAVMAIIYLKFPGYNWFHGFVSFAMITRGIIGLLTFSRE